jgi:hypothetical protein
MKRALVVLVLTGVLETPIAFSSIASSITERHHTTAAALAAATLPATLSLTNEIPLGDLRFQSAGAAAVAFGLSGGLAVWDAYDANANGTAQLMESSITNSGDLVNPVGQRFPLPFEAPLASRAISFVTHSDTGIFAWSDSRGKAFAVRIRTDGQLLDPQPLLLPDDKHVHQVSVTCGDHDCLVLWLGFDDFYGNGPLKGARISETGALLDPVPLDIGASQSGISAVWNGSEYWIVTTAVSSSPDNDFVRRLQLVPLRSSGLGSPFAFVDSVPFVDFLGDGSIAWNGFEGLLAWNTTTGAYPSTHNEIRYSRVDGNGRLLDGGHGVLIGTAPPPVSFTDSGFPTPWDGRVTWDGMSFVVTWAGPYLSPVSNWTLFERITSAGQRLDGDFPNAGFTLSALVPATVVGIGEGRTVISYGKGGSGVTFGSRIRVLQQLSGRRRPSHP